MDRRWTSSVLVSATTTIDSRPRARSLPNAITLPARTPSTAPAARSMSSGNRLRPPTMITSFSRPHTTSWPSTRYARSPVRSQPSRNVAAVASGFAVVPGRHRRAAELELADLAVVAAPRPVAGSHDAQLEAGEWSAEQRQPAHPSGAAATPAAVRTRSCSSAVAIDGVDVHPVADVGEGDAERRLGHPEHGERGAGVEPVRRRRGAERLHRGRVDRLGAVEREPPRRQVEAHAGDAAPAPRARRRSSGPAVMVPRYSEIHSSQYRRRGAGSRAARRARARSRGASASSAAR